MPEHPNPGELTHPMSDLLHQRHFTTQTPITGQIAALAVPTLQEFSPDEISSSLDESPDEKTEDFLDSCVRAASLAVDEARAALTIALAGQDTGLMDHAARAYKQASQLHWEAQFERRRQMTVERRRQMTAARMTGAEFAAALDRLDDDTRAAFSAPPPHSHGEAEMRGDLR